MYDTSLIKQRITCVDVARRCGLPINRSGDRCVSPLRDGAHNNSSFVVDDDFWYDFGDSRGGDCIDLLAEIKHHGDRGQAIRELASLTGVVDSNPHPDGWVEYTQNLCNQIAFWQTQLTPGDYDYLHSRGLNDDTITALKIGRTSDGRLSIPYMKNGYVAYYCTRHLPGGAYPESKYRKQKRDDYCEHVVWGLDTLSRSGDTLIIAEGAFDAISFYQENYPVISAITGFFSREQIPQVISAARKFKQVLIIYDDDSKTSNAGQRFTMRMAELLTEKRIPFVVGTVPHPYHDVSEYYASGGKLSRITDSAEDGLLYIASKIDSFETLESFVYKAARHTKRSTMDALLAHMKRVSDYDPKRLDSLFKAATTAPPETIVADEILREHQLVYINAVGFYEYNGSYWQKLSDKSVEGYGDKTYGEFSTYNRVKSITGLLKTRALQDIQFNKQPVWNFINGTLELDTGIFREHNPGDYCSIQADYPYNPEATYRRWVSFIDDITAGDAKAAEILQFIPGYALFQDCRHEKIFALTGAGGNGKSKYLEIMRQVFGEKNVSHLKPRALLDKFQLIKLRESIINLAGEIRSDLKDVEELMKSIASGEPQTACYKGEQFVDFIPRSKLVFATNGQLTSEDASDALARRLIIVDFKVQFVDNPDPKNPYQKLKNIDILDDLTTELNSGGIFNWVYEGYKLLKTVGYFTETNDQVELINDFKRSSNPVLQFYEEKILPDRPSDILNKQLYADYQMWCVENGYNARHSNWFHREFKNVSKQDYDAVRTKSDKGYRLKPKTP